MKKAGLYFAFFLGIILAISFMSSLVSAAFPYDLKYKTQEAVKLITDFVSPFLEFILGVSSFDQYFWVRVLLLALIFIITLTVLGYIEIFKKNTATRVIISLIIAIFSAKYIGESDIITGILLPYGVLGISLTFLLPFLIFFYFVHLSFPNATGRRLGWVAFAAVFLGLWYQRGAEVGQANWIYMIGFIAVILSIIFDKKIHEYFEIKKMQASAEIAGDKEKVKKLNELGAAIAAWRQFKDESAKNEIERICKDLKIPSKQYINK